MSKKFLFIIGFLILSSIALLAQAEPEVAKTESSIDWLELIMIVGYLGGVFVLFPWVVYTNLKEKLFTVELNYTEDSLLNSKLSVDERNNRARAILEEIENKLSPFHDEESGEELKTITKGSQARFIKRGVEHIQQNLKPTDTEVINRMNEIIQVYEDRTKRIFTGSKWVLGAAIAIGALFIYQMGISVFIVIHIIGILFYYMSSRVPVYIFEKRTRLFGRLGFLGTILSGLAMSANTKHYAIYSDGTKKRDYESEATGGIIVLFATIVISLFLGFLAAALGVVNFLMNYMNNALIPTNLNKWYDEKFASP
ncbi:MAG: hypothetical protein L3J41_01175 [Melioribacteraceae bacterium]|nr:hypothetical protein [Melioribacteraceae bacterium]